MTYTVAVRKLSSNCMGPVSYNATIKPKNNEIIGINHVRNSFYLEHFLGGKSMLTTAQIYTARPWIEILISTE